MSLKSHNLPPRLADSDGPASDLLRKCQRQLPRAPPEAAEWEHVLTRLARHGGTRRLQLLGLVAACVVLASSIGFLLLRPTTQVSSASRADSLHAVTSLGRTVPVDTAAGHRGVGPNDPVPGGMGVPPPTAKPPESLAGKEPVEAPSIRLGHAAVVLPAGKAILLGEGQISLSPGARARAFADRQAATIELAGGRADLQVDKRPPIEGKRFDVLAGPYRFSVLGTRFQVTRFESVVTLSVSEGRVAVYGGARLLAEISGGGQWVSPGGGLVRPKRRRARGK